MKSSQSFLLTKQGFNQLDRARVHANRVWKIFHLCGRLVVALHISNMCNI